ncbi:MAG: lactate utilization protein [Bryobacterales bacterium]|nr:lactate utilization protein [Bryobacterales bacterium]
MQRDDILQRVRTAIGRSAGQPAAEVPQARLRIPEMTSDERIELLLDNVRKLAGKTARVKSKQQAAEYAASLLAGRQAVASNAPFLAECGVTQLAGVVTGIENREQLREVTERADVGITAADYALADTGSLVMLSSHAEARMISLLPMVHLAILPAERILTGLDELYTLVPDAMERTSSMVLITGPSRTADIEQILVRGVHGPGEIHVVVVE